MSAHLTREPAACQWYFTPLGLFDLFVTALACVMPSDHLDVDASHALRARPPGS
jgi:hypothetical protein